MNIGKSIKVACALAEITQDELATRSGVRPATISGLVKGRGNCKQSTMEAIAKAVDMPVSEFIKLGE